jgi:hypothetical protein
MRMLRLAPLDGFALPRLHVEPRQAAGGLRVFDRPSGTYVLVYTPSHNSQFRSGHRAGSWYVRPLIHVGCKPQSRCFDTARAAVDAVSRGEWNLQSAPLVQADRRPRLRVIWDDESLNASTT